MKSRGLLIALCLLGIACNAFLFGPSLRLTFTGVNDFMSMYSGARLAFTGHMYDLPANLAVQQETVGWQNENRLFLRPPFDALLMWPFGQLPYRQAVIAWSIATVLLIALFAWIWPGERSVTALVCCWSYPLFDVFADGQDIALILVFVAIAQRQMQRKRPLAAGMILALCSIKFHLFLLLPVLILSQRLWRLAAGLALGGTALFAISYLPAGPNWPARMLTLLRNPVTNPWAAAMPNLHGLTFRLPHPDLWQYGLSLFLAAIVFRIARNRTFEIGLAATLTGGILIAPHAYASDLAMAVPALLITLPLARLPWQRYFHLFLLSPFSSIGILFGYTWIATASLIAYLVLQITKLGYIVTRNR